MTSPSARVVLDSISPDGYRLTTLQLVMHRFVLAEFNTHRAFSRNGSSSRAIPVKKQIGRVEDDPAMPIVWPSEKAGMQGGEEIPNPGYAETLWKYALRDTLNQAESLVDIGVHKSVVSRLLEPFMWQEMIVTADEWENFFQLRISPMAQPEIRVLAEAMKAALDAHEPVALSLGEWHLPYVTGYDLPQIQETYGSSWLAVAKRVSAARCARVSYLTHDREDPDVMKDLTLAHRLANPPDGAFHASPFEHVASPARRSDIAAGEVAGNFTGFYQFRHALEANRDQREWTLDVSYSAD